MKAMTPPKLIPPFHSTKASGTLPIEQTELGTQMTWLITNRLAASGWPVRNRCCQNHLVLQAPTAPAISRPSTMSRSTAAHSITKMWLTEV